MKRKNELVTSKSTKGTITFFKALTIRLVSTLYHASQQVIASEAIPLRLGRFLNLDFVNP
jgi:hypothetical protein